MNHVHIYFISSMFILYLQISELVIKTTLHYLRQLVILIEYFTFNLDYACGKKVF